MLGSTIDKGAMMIWESAPWKNGLLKDASLLERWAGKTLRANQRDLIFEKKVFLAAYAIRKIFETEKVCTALHERTVPCFSYPRTDSTNRFQYDGFELAPVGRAFPMGMLGGRFV